MVVGMGVTFDVLVDMIMRHRRPRPRAGRSPAQEHFITCATDWIIRNRRMGKRPGAPGPHARAVAGTRGLSGEARRPRCGRSGAGRGARQLAHPRPTSGRTPSLRSIEPRHLRRRIEAQFVARSIQRAMKRPHELDVRLQPSRHVHICAIEPFVLRSVTDVRSNQLESSVPPQRTPLPADIGHIAVSCCASALPRS